MKGRKDPLDGWRKETKALETVFKVLEPLTDHARLRVLEAVAIIHRDDVTARLARIKRTELRAAEPRSPLRRLKKSAGGSSEPGGER